MATQGLVRQLVLRLVSLVALLWQVGRPMRPDLRPRGDTTSLISNACMRREIRSLVLCGHTGDLHRRPHHRPHGNPFHPYRTPIHQYLLIIAKGVTVTSVLLSVMEALQDFI